MTASVDGEAEKIELITSFLEETGECSTIFDVDHRALIKEFRSLGRKIGRLRGWKILTRQLELDDGCTYVVIIVLKAEDQYELRWKARNFELMRKAAEKLDALCR